MANPATIAMIMFDQPLGPHEDVHYILVPYVVGMIMWGAFLVYERLNQKHHGQMSDRLLLNSVAFCFVTEVLLFTINALIVENVADARSFLLYWPPLQALLVSLSRIVLAAAFLKLLFRSAPKFNGFLAMSLGLLSLAYLVSAPGWMIGYANNSGLHYSNMLESRFIYGSSAFMLLVAIVLTLTRSPQQVRLPIATGFLLLFLDTTLALLTLDAYPVLLPINNIPGNLAIPALAYAAANLRDNNRRQLEQGIQNSERLEALGQLSSGIAHDFNNHLQVILGYVELAKGERNRTTAMTTALDRIEDAAEAAGSLVNQLLTFSRGQKTEFTLIDLNELIMGVTPMVSRLLGPDIRMKHDLDLRVSRVHADKRMIEQVFFNLVINARDAMSNGGIIHVATSLIDNRHCSPEEQAEGCRIRLTISDTGCGMDENTLQHAFEPFYTTKPIGKGTGLGLATVYGIAQKHSAHVNIDTRPGKFTRVHIDFPLPSMVLVNETGAPATLLAGNGETILLTEDEIAIRDLANAFLSSFGYRVLVANDGQHAINIVNTYQGQIDLCLFDVIMPRMNGYQTYDKIISQGTFIPALFVTGSTSRAETLREQHPHLQKPFTSEALLSAVQEALTTSENA